MDRGMHDVQCRCRRRPAAGCARPGSKGDRSPLRRGDVAPV